MWGELTYLLKSKDEKELSAIFTDVQSKTDHPIGEDILLSKWI